MIETFFIGDTHFGHKNIITFDEIKPYRPFSTIEEHNEELVRRWNSVVRKKDIVWHLGDFCFGKKNLAIAARLNGDKRLILGNHDTYATREYLVYFSKVYGAVDWRGMILTHIPVHECQFSRWQYNIHGHLHHQVIPDTRYVNVSCEQVGLTPRTWDELRLKAGIII